jgi:anti-sigma regulatory factor (Ser/Thr protein kinase)
MTVDRANTNGQEALTLQSQISELARIPLWIEGLAKRDAIPEETQFAINLCLEEALSNIIRHGYAGAPNCEIAVRYAMPQSGVFVFVIDDQAPTVNPVTAPDRPTLTSLDNSTAGGQGIRLMKQFADTLKYEATPTGNRLCISFLAKSGIKQ